MRTWVTVFVFAAVLLIGAAAAIPNRIDNTYETSNVIETLRRMDSKMEAMEKRLEHVEQELMEQREVNIKQRMDIEDLQLHLYQSKRPRHKPTDMDVLNSSNYRDAMFSSNVTVGKKLDIWKMIGFLTNINKKQEKRLTTLENTCSQLEDKTYPKNERREGSEGNGEEDFGNYTFTKTRNIGRQRNTQERDKPGIMKRASETVAFSVYLDHEMTEIGVGHIILMRGIILNEGNAYNKYTGVFTVPRDGLYLFTFTFDNYYVHSIRVNLVVNGDMKVGGIVFHACQTCHQQGGNSAVLRLSVGQSVWLAIAEPRDNIYGAITECFTAFSGVLLDG